MFAAALLFVWRTLQLLYFNLGCSARCLCVFLSMRDLSSSGIEQRAPRQRVGGGRGFLLKYHYLGV